MRRLLRFLLALCTAAAIAAAPAAAPARAQGDTSAVAINTKDDSELWKFAFQVRRTMKDVVDHTNAAVAYASCTECTTVAISFQVLLASAAPSTVTPLNLALALNEECTSCLTAAFAYQFVLAGEGPYRFTAEGNRRIAELRKKLRDLEDVDLTIDQLAAALDEAKAELRDILATAVIVGRGPAGVDEHPPDEPRPAPSPTPSPDPDAVTTPTPTATPSSEPTATPTATATP
jgi:putative peptide zinc metalloprotease protein